MLDCLIKGQLQKTQWPMRTKGTMSGGGKPIAHVMQRQRLHLAAFQDLQRGIIQSLWGMKSPQKSQGRTLPRKAMPTRDGYCLQGKGLLVRCRGKKLLGLCKTYYGMFRGGRAVGNMQKLLEESYKEWSKAGKRRDHSGLGRNKYWKIKRQWDKRGWSSLDGLLVSALVWLSPALDHHSLPHLLIKSYFYHLLCRCALCSEWVGLNASKLRAG